MNNFIKVSLIFFISFFVKNAQAHNPEMATFTIQEKGTMYILNIELAQTGVDGTMVQLYPELDLENINLATYKELIIKYLKETISISSINGIKVKLGEGGIKLGSHQTSLKFILENFPKKPNGLEIIVDSFSENINQNNILRLLINGEKRRYFLKKENNFSTNIFFETGSLQKKEGRSYLLESFFLLFLLLQVGYYYLKLFANTGSRFVV